jgi:hypothetical protein
MNEPSICRDLRFPPDPGISGSAPAAPDRSKLAANFCATSVELYHPFLLLVQAALFPGES